MEQTTSNVVRFRSGDPALYDSLTEIIKAGKRDVLSIKEFNVLPTQTVFYDTPLSYEGMPNNSPATRKDRISHRNSWSSKALDVTVGCDLIFVDPDNGLEVKTVKAHHKSGPKYTFFEELIPFVERGQSLVIYHHICRNGSAEVQVKERLDQLKEKLGINNIYALLYKRGTLRAFFIVPSLEHIELLKARGIRLTEISPWKEHFSVFD